jgi:small subunit ribosomal protein S9
MPETITKTTTPKSKEKKRAEFWATGKRKSAVARVRLRPGNGNITVNDRPDNDYFGRDTSRMIVRQPFEVTGTNDKFDVLVNVTGSGLSSQAGAVRHGISRALISMNADLRKPLKTSGFLTRDAREKERRKVGCRKARRRPQYSKR